MENSFFFLLIIQQTAILEALVEVSQPETLNSLHETCATTAASVIFVFCSKQADWYASGRRKEE